MSLILRSGGKGEDEEQQVRRDERQRHGWDKRRERRGGRAEGWREEKCIGRRGFWFERNSEENRLQTETTQENR